MKTLLTTAFVIILTACSENPTAPVADRTGVYLWTMQTDNGPMTWTVKIEQTEPRVTRIYTGKPFDYVAPSWSDNGSRIYFTFPVSFAFVYTFTESGHMTGRLDLATPKGEYHDTCTFLRQ